MGYTLILAIVVFSFRLYMISSKEVVDNELFTDYFQVDEAGNGGLELTTSNFTTFEKEYNFVKEEVVEKKEEKPPVQPKRAEKITYKVQKKDTVQSIAKKFGVQPNQITLGNGSNDLLELFAHTFAGEHDEVIYSQYAFIVYPLVTKAINAVAKEIPAKDWGHDLNGFLTALSDKTKLIFIANPNNPTGNFLTEAELDAFLAKVPENVIVVLDEAYTEFTHPNERVNSFALLEKYPNLIVSRSLSKAYGLAGLRIGYAVSNPEIADLLNRVRQPFNCNSLALTSAIAVMNDDAFVEKVAENNRQEMKRYEAFCQQYGLDFIPSKGNFITIDFKQPTAPIYDALLREGVIVRPIAGYGMPNHLRISIGLPQENDKFFTALKKVLNLGNEK